MDDRGEVPGSLVLDHCTCLRFGAKFYVRWIAAYDLSSSQSYGHDDTSRHLGETTRRLSSTSNAIRSTIHKNNSRALETLTILLTKASSPTLFQTRSSSPNKHPGRLSPRAGLELGVLVSARLRGGFKTCGSFTSFRARSVPDQVMMPVDPENILLPTSQLSMGSMGAEFEEFE